MWDEIAKMQNVKSLQEITILIVFWSQISWVTLLPNFGAKFQRLFIILDMTVQYCHGNDWQEISRYNKLT